MLHGLSNNNLLHDLIFKRSSTANQPIKMDAKSDAVLRVFRSFCEVKCRQRGKIFSLITSDILIFLRLIKLSD